MNIKIILLSLILKKEFEFILKHDNMSDEFLNDYTTLYMIKH